MNFIFENFKNILIIILLVVTTFIFTFDFVQTKAFENNPVSLKRKGSILAQEIEAYIPNEKNIIDETSKDNLYDYNYDNKADNNYDYNDYNKKIILPENITQSKSDNTIESNSNNSSSSKTNLILIMILYLIVALNPILTLNQILMELILILDTGSNNNSRPNTGSDSNTTLNPDTGSDSNTTLNPDTGSDSNDDPDFDNGSDSGNDSDSNNEYEDDSESQFTE